MSEALSLRLQSLLSGISSLDSKIKGLEESEEIAVARVSIALRQQNIYTAALKRVPRDYYDWPLLIRSQMLGCEPGHLCKTIIFKNTMCEHDNCNDIYNSKYICVVVQYSAKIATDRLREFIHKLPPPELRLSKKKINFQLAEEENSLKLSGFAHNAVTPIGMLTKIPVIACKACVALRPSFVWLGGGAVDVKLGISVADLIAATGAVVADISDPRDAADEADSVV